jgi:hypothetical protein
MPKACNYEWDMWLGASSGSSGLAPLGVTCYCQHLFLQNLLHIAKEGARHRLLQLRWWPLPKIPIAPTEGMPSTSSTLVVAAARNPDNTHRGPAVDVFNIGGGRCQNYHQHPQGGRHRCLQHRWWLLPDLPPAHPGGLPSTSSTTVVAAARPAASTPRGLTINVFNSGGGCCRK